MHRLILFMFVLFLNLPVIAQLPQSAYSFNCKKEISLPCGQTCLTVNTTVPAIGSSSDQYTVSKAGCFRPNVSPSTPGNFISSTDDLYSPVLILPFDFSFYGTYYNQLTVSTNGMISFDIANASLGAQWVIPAGAASLPSNAYDRAIIMGVYHDVDVQYPNTSPDKRIKYEVTGTAPHRKWVLTFYKVPCFQQNCWSKINNTYQVTLYEGLGLVEVHVFEREICMTWNNGNAMIGMQNYNQDKGIMAPGRSAWTNPIWGGLNMNEAWRFAPNDGAPLLKKVELYTPAGQLVAAGDTVNAGNGNYNVSFANICPDSAGVTYLIKSTYKKIDDPNAEVYGVDTVVIIPAVPIVASVTVQHACPGISNGKITITDPIAPGFTYSINNGSFQPYPVFDNLPAGAYQIKVMETVSGCLFDTTVQINAVYTSETTIHYPKETYCNVASISAVPVVNGMQGGTFTVDHPGLVINANTGVIDVRESDSGYYKITYHFTAADSCMNPVAATHVRMAGYSQYIWTGESVDDNWESNGNWACLQIPNSTSNVFIYSGNVIINSNVTINKLTIMPGAHLTVMPGYNLTILNP